MHLRSVWWLLCNYMMNLNPHQNMEKPEFVGYDHSSFSPKINHLFPSETRAVLHRQVNECVHSPAYVTDLPLCWGWWDSRALWLKQPLRRFTNSESHEAEQPLSSPEDFLTADLHFQCWQASHQQGRSYSWLSGKHDPWTGDGPK